MFQEAEVVEDPGMFLELGVNRLARDLFLLTAAYALYMVMFIGMVSKINTSATRSWAREGRVTQSGEAGSSSMTLHVHLRKDGRIQVGERMVDTPAQAGDVAAGLLRGKSGPPDARTVVSVYSGTASVTTSDLVQALGGAGLDTSRFVMRFTEE